MNGIITIFKDIMLFKKGPQDLPTSKSLLNVFIIANLLISFIPNDVNYNLGNSPDNLVNLCWSKPILYTDNSKCQREHVINNRIQIKICPICNLHLRNPCIHWFGYKFDIFLKWVSDYVIISIS